jgi:hypothetical protein
MDITLKWHGNDLRRGHRVLASIEPDADWRGMWRVRTPDGELTDIVNLTRAKDAARLLALGALDRQYRRVDTTFVETTHVLH